eukprot:gb/GECG01013051.1/.p1 GENE.gb/GECG01013051.1/~~gb/GECG01013051.1/.p1  ORF type:complete len:154 (+),score=8.88 gb/GECG01013051.1/:1-462(+)
MEPEREKTPSEMNGIKVSSFSPDESSKDLQPTLLPSTHRYELLEQIGAGTFGEVYRALDHQAEGRQEMVALKRIRPRTSASVAGTHGRKVFDMESGSYVPALAGTIRRILTASLLRDLQNYPVLPCVRCALYSKLSKIILSVFATRLRMKDAW